MSRLMVCACAAGASRATTTASRERYFMAGIVALGLWKFNAVLTFPRACRLGYRLYGWPRRTGARGPGSGLHLFAAHGRVRSVVKWRRTLGACEREWRGKLG